MPIAQRRLDWLQRTAETYAGYRNPKAALEWVTYERVLGEFGGVGIDARRAYCRFVQAGVAEPPVSLWRNALGVLLVGSESFAMRVRRLLGDRCSDREVPQFGQLRGCPSLERISATVAAHFDCALGEWSSGRRSDAIDRAVAAYLARQRFGYSMVDIAEILGYRGHSSVRTALIRVEAAASSVQKSLATLEKQLANT
jgi:hypothetical protein